MRLGGMRMPSAVVTRYLHLMYIFMNTECEIGVQLLGTCMSDCSTRTIYRFILKMITYLIALLARI